MWHVTLLPLAVASSIDDLNALQAAEDVLGHVSADSPHALCEEAGRQLVWLQRDQLNRRTLQIHSPVPWRYLANILNIDELREIPSIPGAMYDTRPPAADNYHDKKFPHACEYPILRTGWLLS